ncbi:MAG: hypothetical protein KDG89_09040 [Geminicoccaceae bacterium]|nr:hypothetical protein [Geminicoccaceae bacterium]
MAGQGRRPALDGVRTLLAFVRLVPVVMPFGIGIGNAPGVIVTVIFAVPPSSGSRTSASSSTG